MINLDMRCFVGLLLAGFYQRIDASIDNLEPLGIGHFLILKLIRAAMRVKNNSVHTK
jgi:hypothetical protein